MWVQITAKIRLRKISPSIWKYTFHHRSYRNLFSFLDFPINLWVNKNRTSWFSNCRGLLVASDNAKSTWNVGDLDSVPLGWGRPPGRGAWQSTSSISCLGNPHRRRRPPGCDPWGLKEIGHSWATKHEIEYPDFLTIKN